VVDRIGQPACGIDARVDRHNFGNADDWRHRDLYRISERSQHSYPSNLGPVQHHRNQYPTEYCDADARLGHCGHGLFAKPEGNRWKRTVFVVDHFGHPAFRLEH
jgi:hypothetical protein